MKTKFVKIVVYVPLDKADLVRKAIGESGAGNIGNYDFCSFSSRGVGRFRPNDKAKPYVGKSGKIEEVEEERIEVICSREKAKAVIKEIKKVHPYEEIALDVFPLINEDEL